MILRSIRFVFIYEQNLILKKNKNIIIWILWTWVLWLCFIDQIYMEFLTFSVFERELDFIWFGLWQIERVTFMGKVTVCFDASIIVSRGDEI